jgi:hypothetical protein
MLFFAITLAFDLASRTILKPRAAPKSSPKSSEGEDGQTDMSFEEELVKRGNIIGDENEIYTFTSEFCDCCGLRKQFEMLKEKMEKFKNVIMESRIVGKPTKKKIVQTFFTFLQFGLIALVLCTVLLFFYIARTSGSSILFYIAED